MKAWPKILIGGLTAGAVVLQLAGPQNPHPHAWDAIPGFYVLYGLAGAILLVVAAQALGRAAAQKPEDYYDD